MMLQALERPCCHRRPSIRQRTGRATGATWCFRGKIRRRVWISGPYRSIAMEDRARPSSWRRLTPPNSTASSRPMESGSRTSRTSQARPRFTSSHSRAPDRSRGSRPMAVFRCDGDWMAGSCSTLPPTADSWPFRFELVRVVPPSSQVQPSPSSGPTCMGRHNPNNALFPQYSVSPDGQRFLMNTHSQVRRVQSRWFSMGDFRGVAPTDWRASCRKG